MARSGTKKGTSHIDRETLLAHAEGVALPAAASVHLAVCGLCAEEHARTRELVLDLGAPALASPPDALVAQAIGLFPSRPPLLERVIEAIGRLVRVEGGGLVPATAGVRGGAAGAPTRLIFSDPAADVDVELSVASGGLRLVGQALEPGGGPLEGIVWVERGSWRSSEVPLGAHGVFQVERLPGAPFDLVLDLVAADGGGRRVRFPVPADEPTAPPPTPTRGPASRS